MAKKATTGTLRDLRKHLKHAMLLCEMAGQAFQEEYKDREFFCIFRVKTDEGTEGGYDADIPLEKKAREKLQDCFEFIDWLNNWLKNDIK